MASVNYDKCLETILHHEGGYVNHPKDPGGETNLGVTKRAQIYVYLTLVLMQVQVEVQNTYKH